MNDTTVTQGYDNDCLIIHYWTFKKYLTQDNLNADLSAEGLKSGFQAVMMTFAKDLLAEVTLVKRKIQFLEMVDQILNSLDIPLSSQLPTSARMEIWLLFWKSGRLLSHPMCTFKMKDNARHSILHEGYHVLTSRWNVLAVILICNFSKARWVRLIVRV